MAADRLREALEAHEADYNLKMVADHHVAVVAAARRLLALTETGPDYEAATREYARVNGLNPDHLGPIIGVRYDEAKRIVDAALADYLTEEETDGR